MSGAELVVVLLSLVSLVLVVGELVDRGRYRVAIAVALLSLAELVRAAFG